MEYRVSKVNSDFCYICETNGLILRKSEQVWRTCKFNLNPVSGRIIAIWVTLVLFFGPILGTFKIEFFEGWVEIIWARKVPKSGYFSVPQLTTDFWWNFGFVLGQKMSVITFSVLYLCIKLFVGDRCHVTMHKTVRNVSNVLGGGTVKSCHL